MPEGTVSKWAGSYGFVVVPGTRKAAFVHATAVMNGRPQPGDVIRFERLEQTERGPRVVGPAWITDQAVQS